MPDYRSVSQHNSYNQCPYRYKLERIDKVWQRPAAWLPQGTAVHHAAEVWEKSGRKLSVPEAQSAFAESYAEEVNRCAEQTPNFNFWFSSGRYHGEQDTNRRYLKGRGQVQSYIDYAQAHPNEVIWIAEDGTPGIELDFEVTLGDVPVRGFIDQVLTAPEGRAHVRDLKTGKNPGDEFQLATYGIAVKKLHDVDVLTGDYWMAQQGKPTITYDLTEWPESRLVDAFGTLDQNIKAERFEPKPEPSKCSRCSVQMSCDFAAF